MNIIVRAFVIKNLFFLGTIVAVAKAAHIAAFRPFAALVRHIQVGCLHDLEQEHPGHSLGYPGEAFP